MLNYMINYQSENLSQKKKKARGYVISFFSYDGILFCWLWASLFVLQVKSDVSLKLLLPRLFFYLLSENVWLKKIGAWLFYSNQSPPTCSIPKGCPLTFQCNCLTSLYYILFSPYQGLNSRPLDSLSTTNYTWPRKQSLPNTPYFFITVNTDWYKITQMLSIVHYILANSRIISCN